MTAVSAELCRPLTLQRMVEAYFGHCRTGATQIAGRCVDQENLANSVETVIPGDLRRVQKGVPSETVDIGMTLAMAMAHDDSDVVTRMADKSVDEQVFLDCCRHVGPHAI